MVVVNYYFEFVVWWVSIELYYYFGEFNFFGVGCEKLCSVVLGYFKSVFERVEFFVFFWVEVNLVYDDGDEEFVLFEYFGVVE